MNKFLEFRCFSEVARERSFTAAAKTLGLTPSAVSKQVRALEERLGVRLLNRTTRSVSLTEAGAGFQRSIDGVLSEIDAAERTVSSERTELRGTLRVSSPMDFGRDHLAGPMADFAAQHPELELHLEFSDSFVDVVDGGFDAVIRIGELADSSLIARRLTTCWRVLCAAPSYLERVGTPQEPRDLLRMHRIGYANETARSWSFKTKGRTSKVAVPIRHRSNNGEVARRFACAGLGLALLPTFLAADDLRSGRLVTVLRDQLEGTVWIHAVYPHRHHGSARLERFLAFLEESFGASPYWDEGLDLPA